MIFKLNQWRHKSCREVKVRNIRNKTGVIVVNVWRPWSTHMRWLTIKPMWWWAKFLVLRTSPRRMFIHARMWHSVALVMVWWSHI